MEWLAAAKTVVQEANIHQQCAISILPEVVVVNAPPKPYVNGMYGVRVCYDELGSC